jgi:hypothetical protein
MNRARTGFDQQSEVLEMDIEGYRALQQRIVLTATGSVPSTPLDQIQEQESALARIERTWHLIEQLHINGNKQRSLLVPTDTEIWFALRRWFTSHHLFIPKLALIGYALNEVVRLRSLEMLEQARYWMRLACRMRKGCGALFLFGVDFSPCATIYGEVIRKNMPEAFSGFWIRERQHCYLPALKNFSHVCPQTAADDLFKALREDWAAAECLYHELHRQSMYMAVTDGISLARDYQRETGKAHDINEKEFQCYDNWFCIDRSEGLTRLEYIFQVCDVIERVVTDLAAGNRLEVSVANRLLDGAKAAMVVFGHWAGPVCETSAFYPKCLRGE